MRLKEPLLRLPIVFDATRLAAEIDALPPEAWTPHPDKIPGNAAVRLVTTHGAMTDDTAAPMAATPYLLQSPYMIDCMAAIGAVCGRSRLMRLGPGAGVPPHVDTHYYWRTHLRIHVPIVTSAAVLLTCGGRTVHMAAGECWALDTFASHHVRNEGSASRVHLVMDTVGSDRLWDLIDQARADESAPAFIEPGDHKIDDLVFERFDTATIMSPWELRYHIGFIAQEAVPGPTLGATVRQLDRFAAGWAGIWARFGPSGEGAPAYRRLLVDLEVSLRGTGVEQLRLRNGLPLSRQLAELVFTLNAPLDRAG